MNRLTLGVVMILLFGCTRTAAPGSISEAAAPAIRVSVTQPQQRSIEYVLSALGSVESIQDPTISAETSGQVVSIEVSEGQEIVAQQLMATIDNTLHKIEADKAEAELQRQVVLVDNQQRKVNRLLQLAKSQSISKDKVEDEQAQLEIMTALRGVAKKQREQAFYLESKTQILAPQAGIVSRRHISLGDYVTPGQALFDLVSVGILRARIAFPEHQSPSIAIGKRVKLTTPAAPTTSAVGAVTSINPQINPHNRAVDVLVEFTNPGGWLPGASVDAVLITGQSPNALTVPALSVVQRDGNDVVFIVEGGRASQRTVKPGWRDADWVEILEGLTVGDVVVTEGAGLISAGSPVEISEEKPAS